MGSLLCGMDPLSQVIKIGPDAVGSESTCGRFDFLQISREIEELSHVVLSITGYIMKLAPLAVFASMAAIITTQGLGILITYGKFVIEFYLGLAVLWILLLLIG